MANTVIGIDKTRNALNASLASVEDFRPIGGRILIERERAVEKVGSIFIPEGSQERAHKGKVIVCCPTVTWVRPGDVVYFSARGRPELQICGEMYNVAVEQDLYGVEE